MKKLILSEKQYRNLKNVIVENSLIVEQKRDQISQVQQRLKECFNAYLGTSGLNKDGVDGICGPYTKAAIEKYTSYRFDESNNDDNNNKQTDENPDGLDYSDLIA